MILVEKILLSSAGLSGARVCDHHTAGATAPDLLPVPIAVTGPLHVVELVPDATSSVIVAKQDGNHLLDLRRSCKGGYHRDCQKSDGSD